MKKRLIPIVACILLALCFSLAGCGGDSFGKINVAGKQDTSYTVTSQGGNAVQYGNYIYFINGYAGYEDTDGKQNVWPNVVKGGLYRAELTGNRVGNDFVPAANPEAVTPGLDFVRTAGHDSDHNVTDVVNVQRIAPKRIGTAGYKQGGIFIYDEWVYFASPNNEKNKSGNVQTGKTDFFRAKLDGSDAERVYTTKNASSSESAYAFYKYNGAVYLVAQDGTDLVSVRMGKKVGKKTTIAQNVSSVLLPYADTYYNGMSENTLEHFVYVLRAAGEEDSQKTGNVIEIMRPDGKSGGVFHAQGKTDDALEAVRDGLLFYRTTDNANNTIIKYDNLHDFFMGNAAYTDENGKEVKAGEEFGDKAYRDWQQGLAEDSPERRVQMSGNVVNMPTTAYSSITSTYCFRPSGENSDLVYMLAVNSASSAASVDLYSSLKGTASGKSTVLFSAATILNVEGGYMYFTETDSSVIRRVTWAQQGEPEQVSGNDVTDATFNGDYCAGYIVYMGKLDGLADAYTLFKKADGPVGGEPVFVGAKITADTLAAPVVTLKNRELKWKAVDRAESYTVYYQASASSAAVRLASGLTELTYTVDDGKYGQYWVEAVGADGVTSASASVSYGA